MSVAEALNVLRRAARSPAAQRALGTLEQELGGGEKDSRSRKSEGGPKGFPREKAAQMLGGNNDGARGNRHSR